MSKSKKLLSLSALALALAPGLVSAAGTSTSNLSVSLSITNACVAGATTAVNFGTNAGVIFSAISATGAVTASCNSGATYSIGLGNGANASGAQRNLKSAAGATIAYNLYKDAGTTLPWSDASPLAGLVGTGSLNTPQSYPVYGVVPAQNTPAAGSYTDTVLVSVNYD